MTRRHAIVVDLGFGDAGKGSITDWLCSSRSRGLLAGRPTTVVRFNGGAQAGHRAVTADGRAHVFSQFGSGTLRGARTHLSRFMLVDPLALVAEAEKLDELTGARPLASLTVELEALITTPFHAAANRARELARGDARHGSCGMGIGETVAFSLATPDLAPRVGDLLDRPTLRRKLWALHDAYLDLVPAAEMPPIELLIETYRAIANRLKIVDEHWLPCIMRAGSVVFEGAQGVLLDQDVGFHPHTTWSVTTFANAEMLLAEAGQAGEALRLGLTRPYHTRHGAGPLPSEDRVLTTLLGDPANIGGRWQGAWRVGHLDPLLLRYATESAGGIDGLAISCLDRWTAAVKTVRSYHAADGRRITHLVPARSRREQIALGELLGGVSVKLAEVADPLAEIERATGANVLITSRGPRAADKRQVDAGTVARPTKRPTTHRLDDHLAAA